MGVGPQDQLADGCASAQTDHDEVRVDLVGDLDQVLGRFVAADELADLMLDTALIELALDSEKLRLETAGFSRIEVLATTAAMETYGLPCQ